MTEKQAISKLLSIAKNEVGYLEKKSNSKLTDKTANAGNNNYTKYASDLDGISYFNGAKNGYPWCAVFYNWCMVQAFGADTAKSMLYEPTSGNCAAGCTEAYNYYKQNKAIYTAPQVGDQIFFGSASGTKTHTGMVVAVDSQYVTTIEGNTSAGDNTVVANGGGVWQKQYTLSYSGIAGYGRPKWSIVAKEATKVASISYKTWRGGRIYTIPRSSIAHMEHITNSTGKGEYTTNKAKTTKWNGKLPTFLTNAELFNMTTYAAVSGVRDNGIEACKGWQYGIGTDDYKTPLWQYAQSATAKEFVAGYPALINNGAKVTYGEIAGVTGTHTRMGMGYNDTNFFIIYTTQSITLDVLANKFLEIGAKYAINLDGGGSVSIVAPSHTYAQSRKIRGWWAIWCDEATDNSAEAKTNTTTTTTNTNVAKLQKDSSVAKSGVAFKTTASSLNLRNKDGSILAKLPNGTTCMWYGYYSDNVPNMSGTFYWVAVNGKTGLVSKQYIKRA